MHVIHLKFNLLLYLLILKKFNFVINYYNKMVIELLGNKQ